MARFVLLRCSNSVLSGDIVVTSLSSSETEITVPIGTSAAQALQSLSELGLVVIGFAADPYGLSYTLSDPAQETPPIYELLLEQVGDTVTLDTGTDTVSGSVVQVGTDAVKLVEPSGEVLLVPFSSINAIV